MNRTDHSSTEIYQQDKSKSLSIAYICC